MTNLIPDSFVIQSSSHFETHCWIRVTAPRPERCRAANLMVTLLQLVRIWIDRLREKKCTRLYEVSCFVRAGSAARRDSKWYCTEYIQYVRTTVLYLLPTVQYSIYSTYILLRYILLYTVGNLHFTSAQKFRRGRDPRELLLILIWSTAHRSGRLTRP